MLVKKEKTVYVIADDGAPKTSEPGAKGTAPTRRSVAARAYEIYLGRGGVHGRDVEDWLQAERELRGS